ncbi:efflux RND transporter periplasmic adaptor subunit [Carboxylicivirga sp. A043]|uniref:efflux RND transporter periplasmic adaptor subunit n=1 Tax=Carboxylicivirga litoralis TaxID=2816963 RepID=UPI0021CAE9A5|nr:efflux RND transporter periplasmic adaptor subunit [Carboxylicivirga sp. A043]MCU4158083.1 efflux RND transporter periplasmic adaptor subunit [Carboxylicivirga sp. A043]
MKKIIILAMIALAIIALASSCSSKSNDDAANKQVQLNEYKSELSELKKKIAKLEKELSVGRKEGVVNVEATAIKTGLYEHFVDVTGQVETDKNIIISPEAAGKIVSIHVKEGDKVRKGDVLARLNTEMTQRSLRQVEINLQLATTTFERQADLWEQNIGSEMEYLQAKSSKDALEQQKEALEAQLDLAVVRAPIDGIVDDVIQKQGEMAGPQLPFARLVNIDHVYITADVSEIYLQKIKAGDKVSVEFPVIEKNIDATIYRSSSVIDPNSRTFRVRIDLVNKANDIKPNMLAVLKLRTFAEENAIVVPSILVKKDFSGEFIFVAEEEEGQLRAKKRYIQTGIKDNNSTLVTEGVKPGDKVITKGYAQVVDGSAISI